MYDISSGAYLARARYCLDQDDPRYLFYAAYELRCFIECRQNDYLLAQENYRRSLPKKHKVGEQGKVLDRIFSETRIQCVKFVLGQQVILEARYIPVSKGLRTGCEKLGRLLHSAKSSYSQEKLANERRYIEHIHAAAEECEAGEMMCPLLLTGSGPVLTTETTIRLPAGSNIDEKIFPRVGDWGVMHVEYQQIEVDFD